jgi:hypothetical protein
MHAMEDVLSPILLGVFFTATFSICLCGFSIVMVRTLNAHLSYLIFFLSSLFICFSLPSLSSPAFIYLFVAFFSLFLASLFALFTSSSVSFPHFHIFSLTSFLPPYLILPILLYFSFFFHTLHYLLDLHLFCK